MEELQLSETLQKYFSDIFSLCDEERSGNASILKTIELIRSANVPEPVIDEISQVIRWDESTGSLSKKEFFSALKLVAAYQSNLNLNTELITANVDLPLPKFTWTDLGNESPIPDLIELSHDLNVYREQVDTTSTDSEADSDTLSLNRNGSPEVCSTTSEESPTPTNSVQDRNWVEHGWPGIVSEEQRQLLGTEEDLSEKHSSDDETEVLDDVWIITTEQCSYYIQQFKKLQPDLKALLPGPVARTFFEKSRLPVHTLRKIWQLADVTKDGALSLQEFMTAMHLVVLKRNHIEIPDILPPGLIPGNTEHPKSPTPEAEPILSPPVAPPPAKETAPAKEWTKFVESPTNSISSPGPKPVNFDFQKVSLDKDPKILHPKPLRLTPDNPGASTDESREIQDGPSPKFTESNSLTVGHNLNLSNVNSQPQNSAIQRPQPKKIVGKGAIPPPPTNQSSVEEGPVSLPAFPPPKKDKPPPPPPRSFKTHGRSSSLDLNRLTKVPVVPPRVSPSINSKKLVNQRSEGDQAAAAPPVDTQEAEASFANFEQFEKYENVQEGVFPGSVYEAERKKLFAQFSMPEGSEEGPRKHGAFEVYRKPNKGKESPVSGEEKLKWDVFQKMQEENTVLLRLCQELSQELADIREEKLALKVRLEKLINGG